MNFSILENSDSVHIKYNNKKVINKIKIIRLLNEKKPNSTKIDNLKLEIFFMMKVLIMKNINNYLHYSRNSIIDHLTQETLEMESEAFLILDNCIRNFQYKYDFYFYFNKSLSRTFYRMFEKTKRDFERGMQFNEYHYHRNKNSHSFCNFEIDIFNIGLTDDEMIVLRSKMNDETKEIFISNNPKFPMSKYYIIIKKIKNLLTTLKENESL